MKRKIIAIVTAICMMITMAPMAAFAETAAAEAQVPAVSETVETAAPNGDSSYDINGPDFEITYKPEIRQGLAITAYNLEITVKYQGQTLTRGFYYTVLFKDNMYAPGYYEDGITIVGISPFSGQVKLPLTVIGPATDISKASVSYTESNAYTGNAVKPAVTVTYSGKTLVQDKDYSVTYKDCKYPGTYSDAITIKGLSTGSGGFKGTITKPITIKDPSVNTSITKVSTAKNDPYIQVSGPNVPGAKITYKVKCQTGKNTNPWTTVATAATGTKIAAKALAGKTAYAVEVTPTVVLNGKTYTGKAVTQYKNMKKPPAGAISSGDQFIEKITNNPAGKYYLTNNITVPKNTVIDATFTGTLDGKGYAIKNYTVNKSEKKAASPALFKSASKATFKNIKMTGVNYNVTTVGGGSFAVLVSSAIDCTFNNVKIYGKVNIKSTNHANPNDNIDVKYGTIACYASGTMTNCANYATVNLNGNSKYWSVQAGGVVCSMSGNLNNCTNAGKIYVKGTAAEGVTAAGVTGYATNVKNCKNTAVVTAESNGGGGSAVGVVAKVYTSTVNCKNSGNVTFKGNSGSSREISVAGVIGLTGTGGVMKSSNTGVVKFTGKSGDGYYGDNCIKVGGIFAQGFSGQCYNKGQITATVNKGFARVGGVGGWAFDMKNCYNVGKVNLTGKGFVGGLAGDLAEGKFNYNTGAVTGSKKVEGKGAISGLYSGQPFVKTTYKNYYKNSIKPYGRSEVTNKYKATAVKVSAITAKKCPGLSKNLWKYSKKKGRMVLKNNTEV